MVKACNSSLEGRSRSPLASFFSLETQKLNCSRFSPMCSVFISFWALTSDRDLLPHSFSSNVIVGSRRDTTRTHSQNSCIPAFRRNTFWSAYSKNKSRSLASRFSLFFLLPTTISKFSLVNVNWKRKNIIAYQRFRNRVRSYQKVVDLFNAIHPTHARTYARTLARTHTHTHKV